MTCHRCNGPMGLVELRDFLDSNWQVYALRCMLCGEMVDSGELVNRKRVMPRGSVQGKAPNRRRIRLIGGGR
jgi:hypothetical protein